MLNNRDDFMHRAGPVTCQECGTEVDTWIDHIPQITTLCPGCALKIGRRLLEDVLHFHNGKHTSLLGIMHHGEKSTDDANARERPGLAVPDPRPEKKRELFEFA